MSLKSFKSKLTAKLLLPLHLGEQAVGAAEEIAHFAVLVVALGRNVNTMSSLVRQILTDLGDWKDDLLQGAVMADNLNLSSVSGVVVERRVDLDLTVAVYLRRTQLIRQVLAMLRQLSQHQPCSELLKASRRTTTRT